MVLLLPSHIEIRRGVFKPTLECNYAEFIAGLMREKNVEREAMLNQVLALSRKIWSRLPLVTLQDMAGE